LRARLTQAGKWLINLKFIGNCLETVLSRCLVVFGWVDIKNKWRISSQIEDLATRIDLEDDLEKTDQQKSIYVASRFFMKNQISGVNFTLAILSFALARRGYGVTVVTESNKPWKKETQFMGLRVVGIAPSLITLEKDLPAYYGMWSKAVAKYISELEGENNLVVVSTLAGLEGYSSFKSFPQGKHLVYLVTDHLLHNGQTEAGKAKTPRLERLKLAEIRYLQDPNVITIGDSDVIIQDLAKVLGLKDLVEKSKMIKIGIPKNFGSDLSIINGRYLLYIGSVSHRKGTKTLLSAWDILYNELKMREYKLIVCGPIGDDLETESKLSNWSNKLNIVRMVGVSENEKGTLLRHAEVVVIPSNYESFGMVGVEAMQFGSKIVASNIGGLPEVLGECATYFESGNHMELAKVLAESIAIPRTDPLVACMERAKVFGVRQMCLEFESNFG
jgi:glycosyltransferase involved in cell wall biosynthesis